jgi:hypothetical protein
MASLFDLFHRLIVEHGSSEILEKHLSLIKDEFAKLEREAALLESEIIVLRRENTSLQTKNANLEKENARLQERLDSIENTSHSEPLFMQWGCFKFPPDTRLYCPACFQTTGKKSITIRKNTRERFCPVCKTVIPSG